MGKVIIDLDKLESWLSTLSHPFCFRTDMDMIITEMELEIANMCGIKKQAELELSEEYRRELIDAAKEKIKRGKWWHRLFPWQITIRRRN